MNKHDIVVKIARSTGLPQAKVRVVLQEFLNQIVEEVASGQTVFLRNFGSFVIKQRQPKIGRNPNRPEKDVRIPRRAVVKFNPSRVVRELVRQAESDSDG